MSDKIESGEIKGGDKKTDNYIDKIVVDDVEYNIKASSIGEINQLNIKPDKKADAGINFYNTGTILQDESNNLNISSTNNLNISSTNSINLNGSLNISSESVSLISSEVSTMHSIKTEGINIISTAINDTGSEIYIDKTNNEISKNITLSEIYVMKDKNLELYIPSFCYEGTISVYNSKGDVLKDGVYYIKYGNAIFCVNVSGGKIQTYNIPDSKDYCFDVLCNINSSDDVYDKSGNSFSLLNHTNTLISSNLSWDNPEVYKDSKGSTFENGYYFISDSYQDKDYKLLVLIQNNCITRFSLYNSDKTNQCVYINFEDFDTIRQKIFTKNEYNCCIDDVDKINNEIILNCRYLFNYINVYDSTKPKKYDVIGNYQTIIKSCYLEDIIKLVNYMKDNDLGPWS